MLNYIVFDEVCLFDLGLLGGFYVVGNICIGSLICEDVWFLDVVEIFEEFGVEFLVVFNGLFYYCDKFDCCMSYMVVCVIEIGMLLIYVNMVGG